MSRSLHHVPGRLDWPAPHCPDGTTDWWLDARPCRLPVEAHPGGRCVTSERPQLARLVEHDGTVATRRQPHGYARKYYQDEMRYCERANHRKVRRHTRQQLGALTGHAAQACEHADDLLLDDPGSYDAAHDVC